MIGWIRRLLKRRAIEAAMREEMEFHRHARAADLVDHQGLTPEAAERQARLDFGSMESYTEDARAALGFRIVDELRGDVRYAARGLRNSPGFAVAATGILALAIGVNAAFFTLYSNYALKPLPIRAPERHYDLIGRDRQANQIGAWSPEEIAGFREAARSALEGIYATSGLLQVLLLEPVQRQSMVMAVSSNYFPLLGGVPFIGRTFNEDEERQPVCILSDAGWKRLFPDAASPLGRTVRVRSTTFMVIAVMPPSFTGAQPAVPDLWVGSGMREALREGIGLKQRAAAFLKADATTASAAHALTAAAARFHRVDSEPVASIRLHLRDTYTSADSAEGELIFSVLFAVFLLVLLIACANLANLFLARTAARGYEIAMRFALGADRWRIVRQMLTESMLLGLLGAAAGLAISLVFVARVHSWVFSIASEAGANVLPLTLDWRLFAYSALLGLLAGAAFGLLPALDSTAVARRRRRRLRGVLLTAQVAASFVLLICAAILVRNIQRIDSVRAGFDLDRTFDLQLEPPTPQVIARLRSHPGVAGVSVVERIPLYGRLESQPVQAGSEVTHVTYNVVDSHYFATANLRMRAGRDFRRGTEPNTVIVSEGAARRLWPKGAALGQTLRIGGAAHEVIGVAPDVVNGWLFEGPDPAAIYLPAQTGDVRARQSLIRLHDPSPATIAAIRELCATTEGSPGCDPKSLGQVAAMQRFPFQAAAAVAGALGGLALLLAAIGIYSVVSYTVEQRRREIALLVAVGAQSHHVSRRLLTEALRCVAAGLAIGLPMCLGLSYLTASSVFRIQTFDPRAYAVVPALLAAVATSACLVPLRRALRVEPMVALRQD